MGISTIKIGDHVRVYCKFSFNGTVNEIILDDYDHLLFVTEDGFISSHKDSPFHAKQCRKLMKKVKLKW